MTRLLLAVMACAAIAAPQSAPGPAASILVSGAKARLISGESMKLSAVARDANGQVRTGDVFTWSSVNTAVVSVDAEGSVTAKSLGVAEVRATLGNRTGSIWLQVVPARIRITPETKTLFVGEGQQFRAAVLDNKGAEIQVDLQWDLLNAVGRAPVFAAVDRQGNVTASGAGKLRVRARYVYSGVFPLPFVPAVEGLADLNVRLKISHTSRPLVATGSGAATSQLKPRRTLLAANSRGQMLFQGSLDHVSNALLLYDGGKLTPLATAGSPGPIPFGSIYEFQNFSFNDKGEVLSRALVAGSSPGLVLASAEGSHWFASENMSLGGLDSMNSFLITRNSLNNASEAVVRAGFRIPGEAVSYIGLFRFLATGVELVASTRDGLPGISAPFTFDDFGLTDAGAILFRVTSGTQNAIYKQQGYEPPVRVVGTGDTIGSSQIRQFVNSSYPIFFVSRSGELVIAAALMNGQSALLHYGRGGGEPQALPYRSIAGVFGIRDGEVLWYGDVGRGMGLHRWKSDAPVQSVLLHGQMVGGEPLLHIDGAAFLPQGEVVALVRSQTRPFSIVNTSGPEILLETGAAISSPPRASFTGLVGGAKISSAPMLFGGGDPGNVFEVQPDGLRILIAHGDRYEGNVAPFGLFSNGVRRTPDGTLYFFLNPFGLGVPNYGVYRWNNGQVEQVLKLNFTWPDGATQFAGAIAAANDMGDLILAGGTSVDTRMYRLSQGNTTILASNGVSASAQTTAGDLGVVVGWSDVVMTASGRVMANLRFQNGLSGLCEFRDGAWTEAAIIGRSQILDLSLTSINGLRAVNDTFYASFAMSGGGSALAEWTGSAWKILVSHNDTSPTGQPMGGMGLFDVNRRGEIVFMANSFSWPMLLRRGANGDLSVVSYTFDLDSVESQVVRYIDIGHRDDGTVYYIGLDLSDRYVLFEAKPAATN